MNAFEKMLREKFGLTEAFEMALVTLLEQILGPADETKAAKLFQAVMNEKNDLLPPEILAHGERAVTVYCQALGYFGGLKDIILRAAEIIKTA